MGAYTADLVPCVLIRASLNFFILDIMDNANTPYSVYKH